MIERIMLALILLLVGFIAFRFMTQQQLRQIQKRGAADSMAGVPTILYFTTPTCAVCRLQLVPQLEELQAELGADYLRIVGIDVTENWEAAEKWHIFTVPTTIVLDTAGQPVQIFQGMPSLNLLRGALETV